MSTVLCGAMLYACSSSTALCSMLAALYISIVTYRATVLHSTPSNAAAAELVLHVFEETFTAVLQAWKYHGGGGGGGGGGGLKGCNSLL